MEVLKQYLWIIVGSIIFLVLFLVMYKKQPKTTCWMCKKKVLYSQTEERIHKSTQNVVRVCRKHIHDRGSTYSKYSSSGSTTWDV